MLPWPSRCRLVVRDYASANGLLTTRVPRIRFSMRLVLVRIGNLFRPNKAGPTTCMRRVENKQETGGKNQINGMVTI